MAILNGRLPSSMLGTIPGTSRRVRADLVPQVAAWREAFQARFGKPLVVTDAYRAYDGNNYAQVETFLKRYTTNFMPGRPRKWWRGEWWYQLPGTAMAATPGTSNHGTGTALDLGSGVNRRGSAEHDWCVITAPHFGFRWPSEWAARAGEWWHFEDGHAVPVSNYVNVPGVTVPEVTGSLPGALTPRDGFDMAEVNEVVDALVDALRPVIIEALRPVIKAEAVAAATEVIDARQQRDRADMLEQAGKANRAVLDAVARVPAAVADYDVGGDLLPAPAGRFGTAVRDARVIARRTELAVLDLAGTPEPVAQGTEGEVDHG